MRSKYYFIFAILFILFFSIFIYSDGSDSAETTLKPWSGWWWPIKDGGLATGVVIRNGSSLADWNGYPSPMQKYDMVETKNGRGSAFLWEYENHYDPNALSWNGHCDAWAAASIVDAEPTSPGEESGVYFRVGDKKGLLTECNVGDTATMYGHRYNGNPGDDKNDIYPDLFHEKLIEYIKNRNEPIIIENDPGVEVWNYPCFKYEMHWTDDGNIRHVTTTVYLVSDAVDPDYVGTAYYPFTYTYDLQLDDDGNIIGGKWTGSSVDYHPDFIWEVDSVNKGNPNLDYNEVLNISNLTLKDDIEDDIFSGNNSFQNAAEIDEGIYLLRYLSDDYFKIPYEEGENFHIKLNSEKIEENLTIEIYDSDFNLLKEIITDNYIGEIYTGPLTGNGYFYVVIKGDSPQTNRRNYVLQIENSSKVYYLPHIATDDGWNTKILLYNPGNDDVHVTFHFYQQFNDIALQRQYDPHSIDIAPGELIDEDLSTFFLDFTPSNDRWLKIISDGKISATALFEYESGGNIATMDFMAGPKVDLYFPHIASTDTWWTGIAIVNVGKNENEVKLIPYKSDGTEMDDNIVNISLKGNCRYVKLVREIFDENVLSDIAYVKIEGTYPLVGYELFGTNDFSLFEGVTFERKNFKNGYFVYVKDEDNWWNGISILNTSNYKATIRITPLNSDGLNVYGVLNPYEKEVVLNPGEKYVALVSSIFSGYTHGKIAYLKIESNYDIMGFTLGGSFDSGVLYGDLLRGEEAASKEYSFPIPFSLDKLKLLLGNYIVNGNVKVNILAYDESGNLVKEIDNHQIDFRKMEKLNLKDLLGDENVKMLKISSDNPFYSAIIYVDDNLNESTILDGGN